MAGTILRKQVIETDVLTLARQRVAVLFDRYDNINVSFSGGKDSTVVLNLVHEEALKRGQKFTVHFVDEEVIPPETETYVRRAMKMPMISRFDWICLPTKQRNACSRHTPWWIAWDPEVRDLWTREPPPEGIWTLKGFDPARHGTRNLQELLHPKENGNVADVLGIRAAESLRRYRSVAKRVGDNWISRSSTVPHVYTCKPIYDWSTADVWTAPEKFDWDWNRAYDRMQSFGIPRHAQRVAPAFAEEPLRDLPIWRECWPDMWDKVCYRVPGAATAARYAKTPLYGYGGVMADKPGDMTWQEAIRGEIMKFPDAKIRGDLAARVQQMIANHDRKTKDDNAEKMPPEKRHLAAPDPLPEAEPHHATGVCWGLLLMIVKRGDLRNRKMAMYGRNRDSDPEAPEEKT